MNTTMLVVGLLGICIISLSLYASRWKEIEEWLEMKKLFRQAKKWRIQ